MGYESKISTKGQLVVPKQLRDRYHWKSGSRIEFVERGGAVFIRAIPDDVQDAPTHEAVFARIAARNSYRGPAVTLEEMDETIHAAAVSRYERSL